RCIVAPMVEPPSFEPVQRPPAPEPRMTCPKCGQEQPESEICVSCGVVIAKYLQRQDDSFRPDAPASSAIETPSEGAGPADVARALSGTRPWVKLVSILMFIGAAFGLVASVVTLAVGSRRGLPGTSATAGFQILVCLLYFIPASFLFRYSKAIGIYLHEEKPSDLAAALERQRAFWKFVGVLSLVTIVLAVVGILAAILIPAYVFSVH
ncbi:MAG TPA: hypothetical protein VJ955_03035, partial [Desulfuromonadales bacterium]|nr:hypothetical protein [Desulfuromonadales bacterium]